MSNLKLIPLAEDHLEFLLEVRNDDSTRHFLGNNSVFTLENCKNWFKTLEPGWFLITFNDEWVGYLRSNLNGEVGLDIHPNHRKKGYAKMAYQEWLKDKKFATLWVFEDNFAFKLYQDLGFKLTGNQTTLRDRKYIQMYYVNNGL
jgi:GNAT superfamily N-acetyltransferase